MARAERLAVAEQGRDIAELIPGLGKSGIVRMTDLKSMGPRGDDIEREYIRGFAQIPTLTRGPVRARAVTAASR